MKKANPMTRSEKFPPAHQDGVVGSSAITRPTGPVSSAAPDSQVGNASDGSSASQRTLKATPKLLQMGSSSSHSCHRMLVHGSTLTIRSKQLALRLSMLSLNRKRRAIHRLDNVFVGLGSFRFFCPHTKFCINFQSNRLLYKKNKAFALSMST